MKKLIAILLVLAIVVGAVFATSGDKIVLSAAVAKIDPAFVIRSATEDGTEGTAAGVVIGTNKDIAYEDITWTFYVAQKGEVDKNSNPKTHSKYNGNIDQTLTLGSFTGTTNSVEANDSPVVQSVTASAISSTNTDKFTITADSTNKKLVVGYTGKNVADQTIGYFVCKWTKDETLPIDTYQATVTLNYTVGN